jgi:hypothetical protein
MQQLEGQLDGDDFPQAASEDIRDDERARDLIESLQTAAAAGFISDVASAKYSERVFGKIGQLTQEVS